MLPIVREHELHEPVDLGDRCLKHCDRRRGLRPAPVQADERALHRWGRSPSSAPRQGTHDATKAGKPPARWLCRWAGPHSDL